MDFQRELIKIQTSAAITIGLLVGLIVAPWKLLLEGHIGSFIFSIFIVALGVYLVLGMIILTSWLVHRCSRALSDYYVEENWRGVGVMIGAATGSIATIVWVYNDSSISEYVMFFFGGGAVGSWVGLVATVIATRLASRM